METLFQELLFKLKSGQELEESELRLLARGGVDFVDSPEVMAKLQIYTDGRMARYIDNMEFIKLIQGGVYDMYYGIEKPTRLTRSNKMYNDAFFKRQEQNQ